MNAVAVAPTTEPTKPSGLMTVPMLAVIALHVVLALLMAEFPAIGRLHCYAVFLAAVGFALFARQEWIHYSIGYVVGCEVLWRMLDAAPGWQFAKATIVIICFVATLRLRRLKPPAAAIVYLLALLPAVFLTNLSESPIQGSPLAVLMECASSTLSGPICLFFCAWYFSWQSFTRRAWYNLMFSILPPTLGISTVILLGLRDMGSLDFTTSSNYATSGGFGPNQVSAALGLGALAAFIWMLQSRALSLTWLVSTGLLGTFLVQAGLTFSRGGVIITIAAMVAMLAAQTLTSNRQLGQTAWVTLILGLLLVCGAMYLQNFTGGAIQQRYERTDVTGRDRIAFAELKCFLDHPLLGAGLQGSLPYRNEVSGTLMASHTEFTRMLGDHGLLGVLSLLALLGALLHNIRGPRLPEQKVLLVGLTVAALLYMAANAMRTAEPSFLIGLTFFGMAQVKASRQFENAAAARPLIRPSR